MNPARHITNAAAAGGRRWQAILLRLSTVMCVLLVLFAFTAGLPTDSVGGMANADRTVNPAGDGPDLDRLTAAGPSDIRLVPPPPVCDDLLNPAWIFTPTAESDMPDLDPVLLKVSRKTVSSAADNHLRSRSFSDRTRTLTPLYIAHQSLRC